MANLCHWEIPSTDLEKSKSFYAGLFGWQMQGWSEDYVLFNVEDGIGGGFNKVAQMPAPCIQVYIAVDDIPAALAKAEELGGTTEQPKTEIGQDMGYMAAFKDPCGCLIGLWSQE